MIHNLFYRNNKKNNEFMTKRNHIIKKILLFRCYYFLMKSRIHIQKLDTIYILDIMLYPKCECVFVDTLNNHLI